MSVLDGYEAVPLDPLPGAAQPIPRSGFFDNVVAGFRAGRAGPASTRAHQNAYESPYYDQVVSALNARGATTTDPLSGFGDGVRSAPRAFRNPLSGRAPLVWGNELAWAEIEGKNLWEAVERERARDPNFLKDLPDSSALAARATKDRQTTLAETDQVQSRAGLMGTIGGFIGSVGAAPFEPESYMGLGAGAEAQAGGRILAKTVLKDALESGVTNAVGAVVAAPGQKTDAAHLGIEQTMGDVAKNVLEQATFGAILGGGQSVAPHLLAAGSKTAAKVATRAIEHLPDPIRNTAIAASIRAGTLSERALTSEARRALNPYSIESTATPIERAAIHVADRDADVREASPFNSNAPASGAHDDRLGEMMASLGLKDEPSPVPSPAPLPAHTTESGPSIVDRIIHVESGGKATAHNKTPGQTASGLGQFTDGTWLGVYRRHFGNDRSDSEVLALKSDPVLGRRMTELYVGDNAAELRRAGLEDSAGNLYLAHAVGAGGAKALLKADPGEGAEATLARLVGVRKAREMAAANPQWLDGKTNAQVIAWAHGKMGRATGLPVARSDAVAQWDAATDLIPDEAPNVGTASFRPDEVTADADLMQYKSGGDAQGVTDRLRGVEQWNPLYSGKAVVWEAADGRRVIVDGHQRLGLAKRLYPDDPSIRIDATILREADGVSAADARVIGAMKNIAEGSGDAIDAARVLRDSPPGTDLPAVGNTLAARARGLAGLSNEAFGAVLNDVIDPSHAAQVGKIMGDRPDAHMAMISLLHDAKPRSAAEAEAIVRQAAADGFGQSRETQLGMFGDEPQTSLYGPAARVLEGAKRQLRNEKRTFKVLTSDAGRIEQAGNSLDRAANKAKVSGNEQAIAILDATAHRSGPVRDALLSAARRSVDGEHAPAIRDFLDALERIDPKAAAGDTVGAGELRDAAGREGGAPEAHGELAEGRELPGRPNPYDDAVAAGQAGLAFSDPVQGAGAKNQIVSLEHDLRLETESPINDDWMSRVDAGRARYQRSIANLWQMPEAELEALHGRALDAERTQLRQALAKAGVDELPRMGINGESMEAAGERVGRAIKAKLRDVPDDIERLISPRWEDHRAGDLPNADDVRDVLKAHGHAIEGDDEHALASEVGWAMRTLQPGDLEAVARGEGGIKAQGAMVTIRKGYDALREQGVTSEQMPDLIRDAMVRNGVHPATADELTSSVFDMLRPAAGKARPAAHAALPDPQTFRLGEEGDERSLPDILKTTDDELSAIERARACLAPKPSKGDA